MRIRLPRETIEEIEASLKIVSRARQDVVFQSPPLLIPSEDDTGTWQVWWPVKPISFDQPEETFLHVTSDGQIVEVEHFLASSWWQQ